MEENIIEEPIFESEKDSQTSEQTQTENQIGSIYGKFKDAKTLLDAYNSLQGEFTRKSQKLSEIQKRFDEIALFSAPEENIDEVIKYQTDSDKYKKEIEETLAENQSLSSLPNKYRVAFEVLKTAEERLAKNLDSQEFFDKYIKDNETIKSKIIDEYLSNLNDIKTAPKIISGNPTSVHFAPVDKPKTIKEAGEIFSKMLK